MQSQIEQEAKWLNLKKDIIRQITQIDRNTPAEPYTPLVEPKWWLEMMEVRKLLLN